MHWKPLQLVRAILLVMTVSLVRCVPLPGGSCQFFFADEVQPTAIEAPTSILFSLMAPMSVPTKADAKGCQVRSAGMPWKIFYGLGD